MTAARGGVRRHVRGDVRGNVRGHVRRSGGRAAAGFTTLCGLAVVAVALAPTAAAHDELLSSSPDDGSRVSAPRDLTLTYSESLVSTGYRLVVRGPEGPVEGDVELSGTRLVDRFAAPLAPGPYAVVWRVVSADGHPISGRLSFTVRGPATPTTTAGPTAAATTSPTASARTSSAAQAPASTAPSPTAAPSPTEDPDEGSGAGGLVLGGVLAAVLAAAVAAVMAARRSRGFPEA